MKLLSTFIVCIVFTCLAVWPPPARAQYPRIDPQKTLHDFYAWYLHALNTNNNEPLKQKTTALKYLTPELYANAPRLTRRMDADIFICAQDWSVEWEKNFKVAPFKTVGTRLTTIVTLPTSETEQIKIRVTLKKISVGWRIDKVQCAN